MDEEVVMTGIVAVVSDGDTTAADAQTLAAGVQKLGGW